MISNLVNAAMAHGYYFSHASCRAKNITLLRNIDDDRKFFIEAVCEEDSSGYENWKCSLGLNFQLGDDWYHGLSFMTDKQEPGCLGRKISVFERAIIAASEAATATFKPKEEGQE